MDLQAKICELRDLIVESVEADEDDDDHRAKMDDYIADRMCSPYGPIDNCDGESVVGLEILDAAAFALRLRALVAKAKADRRGLPMSPLDFAIEFIDREMSEEREADE